MPYTIPEFAAKHGKSVGTVRWMLWKGRLESTSTGVSGVGTGKRGTGQRLITQEDWPKPRSNAGSPSHRKNSAGKLILVAATLAAAAAGLKSLAR